MLYRITLDLAFHSLDPANDIREEVLRHLDEAVIINPGTAIQESGFIDLEECHHDENPNIPCVSLAHYEAELPPELDIE